MFLGVCRDLSIRTGVNANFIRFLFVIGSIFGFGSAIVVYLILFVLFIFV